MNLLFFYLHVIYILFSSGELEIERTYVIHNFLVNFHFLSNEMPIVFMFVGDNNF